jgi:hypothetical protein
MRSATSITLLASLTAETGRTGPYDRLRPAGHLELRKDVGDVVAHRVRRQAKPASNGGGRRTETNSYPDLGRRKTEQSASGDGCPRWGANHGAILGVPAPR